MMTKITRKKKKKQRKKEKKKRNSKQKAQKNSKRSTFTPIQIQLFIQMFSLVICRHVLMCFIGKLCGCRHCGSDSGRNISFVNASTVTDVAVGSPHVAALVTKPSPAAAWARKSPCGFAEIHRVAPIAI